ncbi:reverse transcriptase [Abeliophyllum distichum]|uniref:Reverse transcriptase n=1 Tax=Abeliophyllum distichum TaxID=126358 RepID=A0ABD1NVL1_9LAMI
MDIIDYEMKFEELSCYALYQFQALLAKGNEQAKKEKARVFVMTQDEAAQNLDVIAGILFVSSIHVYVLNNSGTMHSFIYDASLAKINITCYKSDSMLEVRMPSGRTIDTDKIENAVQIYFDGLAFSSIFACDKNEGIRYYFGNGLVE